MRVNGKWWLVVAALVAALCAVVLWHSRTDAEPAAGESAAEGVRAKKGPGRRVRPAPPAAGARAADEDDGEAKDDTDESDGEEGMEASPKTEEEMRADEEEALVEAFDGMTDKWQEPAETDVPMEEVENFRKQFNKIPKARQEECLQRALNLLPDENIMLLAGILLDKEQPQEYLELVYNDVLNRDESVKKPLLLEIYKDKEHPCWATTAWILDATGETPGK